MFDQVVKGPIGRAVAILSPLVLIVTLAAGCSSTRTGDERTQIATPSATSTGRAAAPPTEVGTPAARGGAMMADLPGERGVVLLGGISTPGAPDLPDMWTYGSERGWREITPPALPELPEIGTGVVGSAFEFDRGSGEGVFADVEGNTWVYDPETNTWEAKETEGGPTALQLASMVYDAGSDRMIVFGGLDPDSFAVNRQTWAYDLDSNTWEQMHPKQSPSPRFAYAMAYDEGSDRVILFGGRLGGAVGDTWAYDYDADSWAKMSPARSPAARSDSGMVYDPGRDRMVLFGGSEDHETAAFRDTWTYDYDEDAWTRLKVEGPGVRAWHAMAFDREIGTVVLFGGGETLMSFTDETWIYDPRADTWSQVA